VLGFYDQVAKGKTIGHALQLTRWNFSNEKRNDEAAIWPAFILYGNPDVWFKHVPWRALIIKTDQENLEGLAEKHAREQC
jgi:hypothetical protein